MWFISCLLTFAFITTIGQVATAQTISLAVRDGATYTRAFTIVPSEPFSVVTLIDPGGLELSAAEWVQTELQMQYPSVFKLGTTHHCNTCDWFLPPGEYIEQIPGCYTDGVQLSMLTVQYGDFGGVVGADVLLSIWGFGSDTRFPSSFGGEPGFVDCDDNGFALRLEGGAAWQTETGVIVPSGALVLNPSPPLVVGASPQTFSHLKAVFR